MYFSMIAPKVGCERPAAHEWASGPYAQHQWLWRFFPAPPGTQRDFLFRRLDGQGVPGFYVVSKRPPEPQSDTWTVQTKAYVPDLEAGARLRFELRANPIVSQQRDGKARRDDVVMNEKKRILRERKLERWEELAPADRPSPYALINDSCGAWLKSRAERCGFSIDDAALAVDGYRRQAEKNGQLRFSTVDFSGELTVVDPDAFSSALVGGIGPAKAFGCGLLLVRRMNTLYG